MQDEIQHFDHALWTDDAGSRGAAQEFDSIQKEVAMKTR